jgi:hypothetical protein
MYAAVIRCLTTNKAHLSDQALHHVHDLHVTQPRWVAPTWHACNLSAPNLTAADDAKAYLALVKQPCTPPEHGPKVNGQPAEDTPSAAQATLYRIMNTAEVMAPWYPSLTKDMHGIVIKPQHWKDADV